MRQIVDWKRHRVLFAFSVVLLVAALSFAVGVEDSAAGACPCEGLTAYYSSSSYSNMVGAVGFCCGTCTWGCSWGQQTFYEMDQPTGCV